jgi:capsular exopolysaccharide synthesis family protein
MEHSDKQIDQQAWLGPYTELVEYPPYPSETDIRPSDFDWAAFLRRRWWICVLITGIIYAAGIPTILIMTKKLYRTVGAVEIAPIVSPIIYRDYESDRPLPNYEGFKNTQADLMAGDRVLRRVAEEIKPMNLKLFAGAADLYSALRQMVESGAISIRPDRRTYLVKIEMITPQEFTEEAKILVNSIIRNYLNVSLEGQSGEENARLSVLQDKRKQLQQKIEGQQETIRQLAEEYGTEELTILQKMRYERLASLQRQLTDVEIQMLSLDSQIQLLESSRSEQAPSPELLEEQKKQVLQKEPTLQALLEDILRYEKEVLISRQTMQPGNPVLIRQEQVLQTLKDRYEEREQEVLQQFEETFARNQNSSRRLKLEELKHQKAQLLVLQKQLNEKLAEQDEEAIQLGRKQFIINDYKEQLQQSKEDLLEINRRIEEIMIESKRPARISIADNAYSTPSTATRKKMAAAVGLGGLMLGLLTALLVDRLDKRIHNPQEVVKRVQVKILGTTTDPRSIQRNLLSQQLNDDYQTIRANLGLLDGSNGSKIILVTSPGVQDGKTTFSVNLATSFANSGKKTLLVDADLRKPDIVEVLNLPRELRGFQDYLFGKRLEDCLYRHATPNLCILASDFRNSTDALDLLAHPQSGERLQKLRDSFDIILIDSPPVLAFADALVLSRQADAVILTTFLGHTSQPDIQEALSRLRQVGAKVIGTVVNNVKVNQGYRSYGYGYGYAYGQKSRRRRKTNPELFLSASEDSSTPPSFHPPQRS